MLDTRVIDAGWPTTMSDAVFPLSSDVVNQCRKYVRQATAVYPREPTAAWRMLMAPTVICRLDFTITGTGDLQLRTGEPQNGRFRIIDGVVHPYECEDRPGGIGVVSRINPGFSDAFAELRTSWPDMRVVIAPGRTTDDHIWVGADQITTGPDVPEDGTMVIVRAEPEETEYHHLAPRSLSTVATEGLKSYGDTLGWWRHIKSVAELPPPEAGILVLKPVRGRRGEGLVIAPNAQDTGQAGMVAREHASELFRGQVRAAGGMYLQPWHPPLLAYGRNFILRVFFGLNFRSPEWHCLGGAWALRKAAVVHGADDAVFGPAVPV